MRWSVITANMMTARRLPQDDESQEQQPTLEMGEEGYNL